MKDTKDFKYKSFQCNHCQANQTKPELVDIMQEIVDKTKLTLYIVGAFRCKVHNKNMGFENKENQYIKGLACDFRAADKDGSLLTGQETIDIIDASGVLDDYKVTIHNTFIALEIGRDYERLSKV